MNEFDPLLLKNQLCFPTYAVSNIILRKYKPFLDKLDLTYTQYICMMVLWEKREVNEKELCDSLYLKTNTLTPLLKRLEEKNYIEIKKDKKDKRNLVISLTDKGLDLRKDAIDIPNCIKNEFNITKEEAVFLYNILYKILGNEKED
ncbi:MAG: MarR family transcriptional regulator [Acholeplasmatales bacterium]|nr:MarR family transcriptional regulator [Acholeplasmatales bacterium]